jgi:hypothetical protein
MKQPRSLKYQKAEFRAHRSLWLTAMRLRRIKKFPWYLSVQRK